MSKQNIKEVTRYIKKEVERELRARTAGRCQFNGCNRILYKSPVTQAFQVFWQVVNTGDEASQASCLRGDCYSSNGDCSFEIGTKTRIEPTKYRGFHWIECFIVKNSICYARSGEFIVRIL